MISRRRLLQSTAALGASGLSGLAPRGSFAQDNAGRFKGVTLNVSTFGAAYPTFLQKSLPEFEALTGATVNYDAPSFPIYNQRADLELSTGGSAYDVVNVTFIYTSRWINSGWLTPLDDFIKDPGQTPADFDVADFLPGALAPETGLDGKLYGIPWTAEALLTGASRFDLVEGAGLGFPDSTDDLRTVLAAVNGKEKVAGFVADNHYGWTFVPYLQAFGGNVFRAPPDDLFPTLDTPEAVAAAEFYAGLLRDYGPDGAVTYTPDQVTNALKLGRVNFTDIGQIYLAQLGDAATSRTAGTVKFGLVPKGPAGRFPGTAVHALGIPKGSRNKEAAWAFIQWALSKQTTGRAVAAGYGSPARRSDIESEVFRKKQVINGSDLAQLALDSLDIAAKQGHMKYRTVAVYPQVDQQLNKAIELIATGQLSAKEALGKAQAASLAELKRAGVKI